MRKLCVLVMVLCMVGALQMVGTANAAEFSYTGYYQVIGNVSDNVDDFDNDSPDDVAAYIWEDSVIAWTAKASDDLYGYTEFRWRQPVWGNPGQDNDGVWWGPNSMGRFINRYRSEVLLDSMWIDFRIPTLPVRIRAGKYLEGSPKGMIAGGDVDWPGIRLTAEFGESAVLNINYFKIRETPDINATMGWSAGVKESDDDINIWAVNLVGSPTPESSLGLYVYHLNSGDIQDWYWDGMQATWINLSGTYRSGRVSVNADFIWDFGDYDQGVCGPAGMVEGVCAAGSAPGVSGDISGYAMDLRANYDADWAMIGLIFAFSTGDDNLTDTDFDGFFGISPWYTATNLMWAGRRDWYQLRSCGIGANGATVALGWQNLIPRFGSYADLLDYNGITFVQANISKAFTPKFTGDANVTFLWSTEDGYYPGSPIHEYTDPVTGVVTANTDKTVGTEVDINATYRVYDQLTWFFESGFLFPGDYYRYIDGDPDDADTAWELQTGVVYSW